MSEDRGFRAGKKSTTRLDLSFIREAVYDERQWVAVGIVQQPSEGGAHYTVVSSGSDITDVTVEVTVMPTGEELTCRLGMGTPGGPIRIPAVGDEVLVMLPAGSIDFMPSVIGYLSGQNFPDRTSTDRSVWYSPDRIEIIAPTVYISSNGTAGQPLVTKAEFDAHVHPTGTGPSGIATNAPIVGTTVLKAE